MRGMDGTAASGFGTLANTLARLQACPHPLLVLCVLSCCERALCPPILISVQDTRQRTHHNCLGILWLPMLEPIHVPF